LALLLSVILFVSGAAGVLFETLWFRVAGLTLGNSVWASNIVLASFMAGLAAGNAIAARYGERLPRPLQLYAVVEGIVAVTGLAIVVLVPPLSPWLGRLFTHLLAHAWLVNLLRLTVAFSLMLIPATAMGLTLPLLAKATSRRDVNYGRVLGRLYGWNTLGGMAGALGGELWLIGWLGQRGTALAAGALNLTAAVVALLLAKRVGESVKAAAPETLGERPPGVRPLSARSWRLLTAAFLAGATLLALEIFWFRFLQLFVFGTSFIFAAMLAVILLGIGAGGVLAGQWLGRDPQAQRFAPLVALAVGVAVELSYVLFDPRVGGAAYTTGNTAAAFLLFLRLMLPTSVLSGVLFTLLGAAQRQECGEAAEATGKITLANTLGAMVGALLAGFVLLPRLGMEKALFISMLSYGVVACLTMISPATGRPDRYQRKVMGAALALFALGGALYPFGLMKRHFVPLVLERYKSADLQLLAMREGLTETVMYLRQSYRGQPLYHRLMTNGHSMSATTYRGRRYMKLYAYWALAVNPGARKALLISYGIGTTAKALTDTRQLESIDVVDISRDVLGLGSLAFPMTTPPLGDPRVHVHVEDGRFFLQTTNERFDLITAEPPPLRGAGVTSLYSREYFQLVRDRLRDGGVATYWLPVNQLWLSETQSIIRGFCDAFLDCSLWSGAGLQWMMAGTRGAHHHPVPEEQFTAQWRDPVVAPELVDLGFERPESLGATFLADAATLSEWTEGATPLDDDHPGRILARYPADENGDPVYRSWMQPRAAHKRFESSAFIRDVWPPALRRRTGEYFGPQGLFDDLCVWGSFNHIVALYGILTLSSLRTLPLLFMDTEPAYQRIAVPLYDAGARDTGLEFEMGARAMSERDYESGAKHLAFVTDGPRKVQAQLLRTLALGLLGRERDARDCLDSIAVDGLSSVDAHSIEWLAHFLQRGEHRADPADSHKPAKAQDHPPDPGHPR
jgi:spermidine synthase